MPNSIPLYVGNLPSNRLALTNRVYVSPESYNTLNPHNHSSFSNMSPFPLLLVGRCIYAFESYPNIPNDQLAMNGLQRRYCQYSLGTRVSVESYTLPEACQLCSIEVCIDLLIKSSRNEVSGIREFNTDRLAHVFHQNYHGQILEQGQILAMDFEGIKVELTVWTVSRLSDTTSSVQRKNQDNITFGLLQEPTEVLFRKAKGSKLISLSGSKMSGGAGNSGSIFLSDFDFAKLGIGGLDKEFNHIFRRAFASRIWPSNILQQMGIHHIRGMLLYGPPGCGKTLIARQIGKVLNARKPKIVNGPEILNKYVGGSEEKIRELFAEAEQEQRDAGDASMLHIIILDEMDAICKSRGTVRDSTGVSDSVVNQLLSKIDGVDSLNNILLIGMTNRLDMIDDALLRPGRLEVHVEIGLPDKQGRLQILHIHTHSMRKSNRMTKEVLENIESLAEQTKNYSGAELEGLVKAATSYALTRCVDMNDLRKAPDNTNLMVRYNDFKQALKDVQPSFGAKSKELQSLVRNNLVSYGEKFDTLMLTLQRLVTQVQSSDKTPLLTLLLHGEMGCGKTAIAAKVALNSGYPFVRMISADEMIGYSESSKCQTIHKVFLDAYKSPLSLILLDDIERIIDYVPIGPRFSNTVLQTLLVLLKKVPPDEGRKLLIIGTSGIPISLESLGLLQAFSVSQNVNHLKHPEEIAMILRASGHDFEGDVDDVVQTMVNPIGIKSLLMVVEMAKEASKGSKIRVDTFLECLHTVGQCSI